MNPTATALLAVGGAVLTPTLLGAAVRAGVVPGVLITPYLTEGGSAVWASLSPPICGVGPDQPNTAEGSAYGRATGIQRALIPLRGGSAAPNVAKLTADDLDELLTRFLAACAAGVAHGYKVSSQSVLFDLPAANQTFQERAMDALSTGTHPDAAELVPGGRGKLALTDLGTAVLAAAVEKNRVRLLKNFGIADATTGARLVGRLAIEMDDQGYLITGKPPEDPTIAGGLGAALDASVDFVVELPATVATKAAEFGLSAAFSKLGMLAIAGFVVWKVMSR